MLFIKVVADVIIPPAIVHITSDVNENVIMCLSIVHFEHDLQEVDINKEFEEKKKVVFVSDETTFVHEIFTFIVSHLCQTIQSHKSEAK